MLLREGIGLGWVGLDWIGLDWIGWVCGVYDRYLLRGRTVKTWAVHK
jgi:hypothetical protein